MLPVHHKHRPHAKTNGVYLCAVVSLAVCLLVTFRYWKTEVNDLLQINQQLREEMVKKNTELVEAGVRLSSRQGKVQELEDDLTKRKSSISDLTASLEKEATKSSELAKKNEAASRDYHQLEQLKSETESKLESCQKDLLEKTEVQQKKISSLEDELEVAKTQIDALTTQIVMQQNAAANVQHVQTTPTTTPTKTATVSTATTGGGQTETVIESGGITTHVQSEKDVASQEEQSVKDGVIEAVEVRPTNHEHNNGFQLEAPEKRDIDLKDGLDDKDLHVKSTMEMGTSLRDDIDMIANRRSGNQGAQAETLTDALKIEANEEVSKAENQETVVS